MNPEETPEPDTEARIEFDQAVAELHRLIRQNDPCPCEKIFAQFSRLSTYRELVLELIYTEYVVCEERGQAMKPDEWLTRFPGYAEDLQVLFQVHDHASNQFDGLETAQPALSFDSWTRFTGKSDGLNRQIGKYELLEMIGQGGGGTVYRARHLALGRIVALKTLHHDTTAIENQNRFRIEAEAASRLQHPHIVQILEVGVHEGRPYLTMEYVAGGNLAEVIRQNPLSAVSAARLLTLLARAVHFAHQNQVIHRDLKPANILLATSDRSGSIELQDKLPGAVKQQGASRFEPKITDFGLAKRVNILSQHTVVGAMLGTPSYMAPEQAAGESSTVTPACDIYALGAILYDMLVGRPPFHAANVLETLQLVRTAEPVAPRSIQSSLPRDIETICLKCLNKDPHRRYTSAAELADDLDRFLERRPIHARPTGPIERLFKWTRRHPAAAAMFATLMVATLAISWFWFRAEIHRVNADRQASLAVDAKGREQKERLRLERALYAHDISLAAREYKADNTIRARQLLEGTPQHLRNWEWNYLTDQCSEERWDFSEFELPIRACTISADGHFVASAPAAWGMNNPSPIKIRNLKTGLVIQTLEGHTSSTMGLDFSPDGKSLASIGVIWRNRDEALANSNSTEAGGLVVWDWVKSTKLFHFEKINGAAIKFSPDGRLIAAGQVNGSITIFELQTGAIHCELSGHTNNVADLVWSPNGLWLASAGRDGSIRTWSIAEKKSVSTITGLADVRFVDFSPNGAQIACSTFNGLIKVFRQNEGVLAESASFAASGRINALRYSPDGLHLAVSVFDAGIQLIYPLSGKIERVWHGHHGAANMLDFNSAGDLLASSGFDGHVKIWDLALPVSPRRIRVPGSVPADAAIHPNGQLIALAMSGGTSGPVVNPKDTTAKLLDLKTGKLDKTLIGHSGWLTCVSFDKSGSLLLTGSEDQTVRLWNVESGQSVFELKGHVGPVRKVSFSGTAQGLVSLGHDQSLLVWNPLNGVLQNRLELSGGPWIHLATNPTTNVVAVASASGIVQLLELPLLTTVAQFHSSGRLECLSLSPNGRQLAIGNSENEIELFEVGDVTAGHHSPTGVFVGHVDLVTSVCFDETGARLVSSSLDRTTKLWDVESRQELLSLSAEDIESKAQPLVSAKRPEIVLVFPTAIVHFHLRDHSAAAKTDGDVDNPELFDWHQKELALAEFRRNVFATVFHLNWLLEHGLADPTYFEKRAVAYGTLGQYEQSLADYTYLASRDSPAGAQHRAALLALHLKRLPEYQDFCMQLFQRNEDATNGELNRIAWTCSLSPDSSVDPTELLTVAERAQGDTLSVGFLNTLGAAQYRAGKVETAIATLNRCLELRKDNLLAFDWIWLSICHASQKRSSEAVDFHKQAKEWLEMERGLREAGLPTDRQFTWDVELQLDLLIAEAQSLIDSLPKPVQSVNPQPFVPK